MRIVEARDHRAPFQIDNLRAFGGVIHHPIVITGGEDLAVGNSHRFGKRVFTIERMNLTFG
ncbi:hypothetical protein D3C86_2235030 [compost metagenome]